MSAGSGRTLYAVDWPPPKAGPKAGGVNQDLPVNQQRALLQPLPPQQAPAGQLVTARSLKARYETQVGHAVPDSTVYRLLARHQWRRKSPRPKHPKGNPAARAALKTSRPKWTPWWWDTRPGPCA